MKLSETSLQCQIPCFDLVANGIAEAPASSAVRLGKLMIRRRLTPAMERSVKNYTNECMNRLCGWTGKATKPPPPAQSASAPRIQPGDWVRVRSREEIEGTLNHWKQVRGCTFMPEMAEYCGTVQRVIKNMNRFVDERDLVIKRSPGIILLEGATCRGTAEFGTCDRSCLHFWRKEWLEKLEEPPPTSSLPSYGPRAETGFVKIRPLSEIEATLDRDRRRGGCTFLPEMAKHCGTVQRILKPLRRFVDERDLRVKNASGIVLLEGIVCEGSAGDVNCDRSCPILWREEWLQRAVEPSP